MVFVKTPEELEQEAKSLRATVAALEVKRKMCALEKIYSLELEIYALYAAIDKIECQYTVLTKCPLWDF